MTTLKKWFTFTPMKETTTYVPYEKSVHIHRAPTDKSVELLNEMQRKAQQNIINTVLIEENHIKGVAIYFQNEVVINKMKYFLRFNLNGKDYSVDGEISKTDWDTMNRSVFNSLNSEFMMRELHKKFSEAIAAELMQQCSEVFNHIIPTP